MPKYQYRCDDCSSEFEQFQKFSEDALTVCPTCQGTIRRVIGPVGVVFKGSGWYITDSRSASDSGSTTSGSAKKEDASTTAKSDTPADSGTKPAAASSDSAKSESAKSDPSTTKPSKPAPTAAVAS